MAADSFVGEGLNPSPYKEALDQVERLRYALDLMNIQEVVSLRERRALEAENALLRERVRALLNHEVPPYKGVPL